MVDASWFYMRLVQILFKVCLLVSVASLEGCMSRTISVDAVQFRKLPSHKIVAVEIDGERLTDSAFLEAKYVDTLTESCSDCAYPFGRGALLITWMADSCTVYPIKDIANVELYIDSSASPSALSKLHSLNRRIVNLPLGIFSGAPIRQLSANTFQASNRIYAAFMTDNRRLYIGGDWATYCCPTCWGFRKSDCGWTKPPNKIKGATFADGHRIDFATSEAKLDIASQRVTVFCGDSGRQVIDFDQIETVSYGSFAPLGISPKGWLCLLGAVSVLFGTHYYVSRLD